MLFIFRSINEILETAHHLTASMEKNMRKDGQTEEQIKTETQPLFAKIKKLKNDFMNKNNQ